MPKAEDNAFRRGRWPGDCDRKSVIVCVAGLRSEKLRDVRKRKPKLGQNFLVSATAQAAIVDALGDVSARTVAEIGPGRGALTGMLASRARRLVVIELDAQLAAQLRLEFAGRENVEVRQEDVLATDFAGLRQGGDRLMVVGNLPYYITSDILLRLFRYANQIERAVLTMQREVGERVAAPPGGREYGVLSATAQLYARVERLMTLPPGAFSPPPEVHSTVLRLTMAPRFKELGVEPDTFVAFVRACFAQKRKMLGKNLRNAGHASDAVTAALEASGIAAKARAEEVDLPAMAAVWRRLRSRSVTGKEK
jgi:16S rRNA (adenine1518-N6/adenine1519-N6)-dimethyltransferase